MAPKFRGNSEDWLDDQKASSRARKHKAAQRGAQNSPEAGWIDEAKANARVLEVYPKLCRVKLDSGEELVCSYRRAAVLGTKKKDNTEARERSPVAVGDRALVEKNSPDSGVVQGLTKRRNQLLRPAPGREGETVLHVLAANVDRLCVVASCQDPEFSEGLVDRFLVAAEFSGIPALLIVTKQDLFDGPRPWEIYRELGYEVHEVSVRTLRGIAELSASLASGASVFCGHSGVGKTSLLTTLIGRSAGKTGEVSSVTGKGKHTTSVATWITVSESAAYIDTPGVKEFRLAGLEPEQLRELFPELRALKCAAQNCLHENEGGCLAVDLPRYESYRRILESIRDES